MQEQGLVAALDQAQCTRAADSDSEERADRVNCEAKSHRSSTSFPLDIEEHMMVLRKVV